jgi:hypothetical protein
VARARLWYAPPANRKKSQTKAVSCGLKARLMARQATPAETKRSRTKHYAAITQSGTTNPAGLPK